MEKLVLIDGNSLINRAFYAMPLLSTKSGVYTNAVYGFLNMFFKMLKNDNPSHVAVAFDLKAPTFRHEMYKGYKATRRPMAEELRPQIPLLKRILKEMNVAIYEKEGVEADDVIGTIAKNTHIPTIIYTGDRDSFQLVDAETSVCFTKRGITEVDLFTESNFKEKTGITPPQIIDLKSLMGDASDNIPGIAGVGEKTALQLLQTYGNLENVLKNTENLKGKLKEKVAADKDSAILSKTLATINVNCGISFSLDQMKFSLPLSQTVKTSFEELEFKGLLKNEELFSSEQSTQTSHKNLPKKIVTITSDSEFGSLDLLKKECICFIKTDETLSLYDGETEIEIAIRKTLFDEGLTEREAITASIPFLTDVKRLIVFNKKDLKHYLKDNFEIKIIEQVDDISLAKYVADFSGGQTISDFISEYGLNVDHIAASFYYLFLELYGKLEEQNLISLYRDVELPLSDVLFDMENSGFKADENSLRETGKKYAVILSETEAKIKEYADDPDLNVNSPKKLGEVIFDKLKLGKAKKTKTGYSTSAETLEEIENSHPIIPLILKYRKIQKLQSTYIEGFFPLIDEKSRLIHTSFMQTVTTTGRLSSKEPNLQNIPVRDNEGKELRKFFVPKSDERILISADYSQIELRLLAAFSEEKGLINAFNAGVDVHAVTASKIFGVPQSEVTADMRREAKVVNFGIIYGMSEFGLAKNLKTTAKEAKKYIDSYFREYPAVKKYMESNVEKAKTTGYAQSILGRRRYINELNSPSYNLRQFGERAAMNMPLQGSSADIIKLAMLGVYNRIQSENLKSELILQVHDELIIDAFKDEKDKIIKILKEEMETAVQLSVPLTVEIGIGENWFDAK